MEDSTVISAMRATRHRRLFISTQRNIEIFHPMSAQNVIRSLRRKVLCRDICQCTRVRNNFRGKEKQKTTAIFSFLGEKPYQCLQCGKRFIHYSSFNMHMLMHDDVRLKKCDVCGLALRSSSHLSRHMRVHTGKTPLVSIPSWKILSLIPFIFQVKNPTLVRHVGKSSLNVTT